MTSSETPLSDLISRCIQDGSPNHVARFEDALLTAHLGVIVSGIPEGSAGSFVVRGEKVSCRAVQAPDGRIMLHACADLAMFVRRYNPAFNAELDLRGIAGVVFANPGLQGVLINSAASEHSIALDLDGLRRLVQRLDAREHARSKPWWKFW